MPKANGDETDEEMVERETQEAEEWQADAQEQMGT